MFESATVKLTAWYLAIIVVVSLLFSIIIYAIASTEMRTRITYLQTNSPQQLILSQNLEEMRRLQIHQAEMNLTVSLVITNLSIWLAGGIGSYYLARRTLIPIEEAHEAQSRFTSDASHELRTPLASMKTELEVALRDPHLQKSEMRELLNSNLEEVDKLSQLSQTLLQLSQLDHANITRGKVDIKEAVFTALDRFDKASKRVTIDAQKSYTVYANRLSVEELLTIFIDNALKYSPENSPVTITILKQKNMAGFNITNDGPGIKPKVLPHIFDRFYRADTSRTGGAKKGYGLGLSLAKKIVELHSGELTVSSKPGHTTFTVLLPQYHVKSSLQPLK